MASLNVNRMASFSIMIIMILPAITVMVEAGEVKEKDELIPSCTALMMRMAKKQLKLFGECSKELKATVSGHEEFGDKIQCVVKCVLDKAGMLNAEKRVTKESFQIFMDNHVPELFHVISQDILEHCVIEFGPRMDHSEELCTAYGDYVKCLQDVVSKVC